MSYQALARKWRPKCFADLVGQQHVVRALNNAISRNMLHHAYLFTGTRGVGKTTLARIFAKCLNCERGVTATPCGTCSICREIDEGRFIDLLEIDAASRTKVDQTRELLDNVPFAPTRGRYKIYLIDEVHMFSSGSFNALLKTLEEPPSHVKFVLATTDPQKLPVTVLSRCLQFNLKRLLPEEIRAQLANILDQEGIKYESAALYPLAQAADGSMRDGLSLLDQAIAYGAGEVIETEMRAMLGTVTKDLILDLSTALAGNNSLAVLNTVDRIANHLPNFSAVLTEILSLLHQIAVMQIIPGETKNELDPRIRALASTISAEDVQLFYQIGLLGQRDLELAPNSRVGLDMVLLRMLAFRPTGSADQITSHKSQQTRPIQTPEKLAEQNVPSPPLPIIKPADPITSTPILQPSTTTATDPIVLATNDDWHCLVSKLNIKALAGEVARNCELESWDGQTLRLHLDAAYGQLRTVVAEERLLKVLQQILGPQTKLHITIIRAEVETPAKRDNREVVERHKQQQRAFMEDPLVQSLQDTFQAQIVTDITKYS